MKTFTFTVKLAVADVWINDGFDEPKYIAEQMEEMLLALLPYAYDGEFEIVVTPRKTRANKR